MSTVQVQQQQQQVSASTQISSMSSHLADLSTIEAAISSSVQTNMAAIARNTASITAIGTSSGCTQCAGLEATVSQLQATVDNLSAQVVALISSSSNVCSRPLCGNGTVASEGECIPDCGVLRERRMSCEPYVVSYHCLVLVPCA